MVKIIDKTFFQKSNGDKKLISEPNDKKELMSSINNFFNERKFKSPYMRVIETNNGLKIDFGSWYEFLFVEGLDYDEFIKNN